MCQFRSVQQYCLRKFLFKLQQTVDDNPSTGLVCSAVHYHSQHVLYSLVYTGTQQRLISEISPYRDRRFADKNHCFYQTLAAMLSPEDILRWAQQASSEFTNLNGNSAGWYSSLPHQMMPVRNNSKHEKITPKSFTLVCGR